MIGYVQSVIRFNAILINTLPSKVIICVVIVGRSITRRISNDYIWCFLTNI